MEYIDVKNQAELDTIDENTEKIIRIKSRRNTQIYISKGFRYRVVACGNSSVVARGNSSVEARGNGSVVAWGNSSVVAWENSSVVAWENSSVVAWENSSVVAWGNSSVVACENSSVVACGNSSVVAWENSSVVACGNSSVVACGNSSVVAWENSSVVARGNGSVVAWENSQVNDKSKKKKIKVFGNARVVYDPETIDEYIRFYDLKTEGDTVHLFKAVHKRNCVYFSDYEISFHYEIGHAAVANRFDNDRNEECGAGIHMAHLNWCLDFGRDWEDLAILEVTADKSSILVPKGGSGKVRATKAAVVREVPLEECGLYGKMLAKRRTGK